MKSIDEMKMVLHNSAIVVNDCKPEDFPTLVRNFSTYDPIRHAIDHIGIYYDKSTKRLFLPRGADVD